MKGLARFVLLAVLASATALMSAAAGSPSKPPEFTHKNPSDWINSDPLTLAQLKGKVVVVEFWAFDCVNCVKSHPWVAALEHDQSANGLVVVGVHTPELREERDPAKVHAAVEKFGIHYPVMIDGDSSYWNALHITVWPTWCLIGRDGLLQGCVPGEMDVGDARATQVRTAIDMMVKAPAA